MEELQFDEFRSIILNLIHHSQPEEKVVVKRLCAKDVYGNPKFLWLPKKHVEENLLKPPFPKKGQVTDVLIRDPIKRRTFTVELVRDDEDEYQISGSGWDEYAAQHKLECGDFIYCYEPRFFYEIYTCKLHNKSIEIIPVLVKNLCAKDVAENPNCLRLSKEESRLLVPHVLLQVGHSIFLPLNDTITKESIVVLVDHPVQDEYYITGTDWEEYVAKHKLLIIEDTTIFVNMVILDPTAKVQLVNTSYHFEITYQTTTAVDNSSAPPTTTAVDDSSVPASTATTLAVDNSSESASTATTSVVDNSPAPPLTATTTAVDNSSAPASTATTSAVNNSSAPPLTATTTTVDNRMELHCDEPEYDSDEPGFDSDEPGYDSNDAYWL
uniref:Insect intestinal mucin 2 n=1 Tax=Solanum tuberosum TaxID=4113 RepID=M1DP27_SOLTU